METIDRKQPMNALANDVTKQNESYISDFYYAVQISVCLMKPIGIWPLSDEISRLKMVLHKLSMMIATFLLMFTIVPWIVEILVMEKWNVFLILRTMCPLLFTLMILVRYILMLWNQDRLRSCIDHVVDDWRYATSVENRNVMLANAKTGRAFGIVSVAFMFSCGILYYALPLVLPMNTIGRDNITLRLHPSPCEFLLFDAKTSPAYEIVYFLQVLSGCTAYSTFCGICSLMANFVTHVCGQCDISVMIFKEIVDGGKYNNGPIENRIATAVTRHLRLLRLVSDVSNLFTEICLVEFMNASCNICLLGYYIVIDLKNNESFVQISMYLFGLASIIFNVFIFCYIGDLLKERCQKVGAACYAIEWYRMPSKRAIDLIMPIVISRYPATLTAGKMMTMTLTTFSDILKTSMAYFNLLREFSSRDAMRT